MRNAILLLMLFVMSAAVYATDYLVEDGDDFGSLYVTDYDTLLMTGGTASGLSMGGWSTGVIEDTGPLSIGEGDGGIWEIMAVSYSELTINGGEFYDLEASGHSTINLHGGNIFNSLTISNSTAWIHIYGYGFNNEPFTGNRLTGYWGDGTSFNIKLVDDNSVSTYDQIVFHTPEPATLALLGFGGILLRKRK